MVGLFQKDGMIHQQSFRAILNAASRPGSIQTLPPEASEIRCLQPYLMTLLETLLDQEVSHFIADGDGIAEIEARLYDQTQSPAAPPEEADFIIAPQGSAKGAIRRAKCGDPAYPDQSATVIYCVRNLSVDIPLPRRYRLSGPGISGSLLFPPMTGFDWKELELLSAVNAAFPLGLDAFFVDEAGRLLGLPRSTRISLEVD